MTDPCYMDDDDDDGDDDDNDDDDDNNDNDGDDDADETMLMMTTTTTMMMALMLTMKLMMTMMLTMILKTIMIMMMQMTTMIIMIKMMKKPKAPSARKESCPSYGEPNKGTKERQRPTICYTYNHHQKCWKGLYLFFSLLSPVPDPMLSKTLMFVPVIVLLYPNIEYEYVFPT